MNYEDCAKLVNYANAMLGRAEASDMQVFAWFDALGEHDVAAAKAAVVAYVNDPGRGEFFRVTDIVDRIHGDQRRLPHQVEGDVRSAKARGLIGAGWSIHEPLPADVAARLAAVRRAEAERLLQLEAAPSGPTVPFTPGLVGRVVPDA